VFALAAAIDDDDSPVEGFCVAVSGRVLGGAATGASAGRNGERPAVNPDGALFLIELLVPSCPAGIARPIGFGERITPEVVLESLVPCESGGDSCEAHMSAKLRECGAAESARPKTVALEAAVALQVIADSMAEVTRKVRADIRAHTRGCTSRANPRLPPEACKEIGKGSGIKRIHDCADGSAEGPDCQH